MKPCRKCGSTDRYNDGKCRPCKIKRQEAARRANGVDIRSSRITAGGWREHWGAFEDDPKAPKREAPYKPRHHGYVPSASVLDEVAL